MPRLLTFSNGVQSRGDGFIKSPACGMWQCTLSTDVPLPQEESNVDKNKNQQKNQQKKEEAIVLQPRPSHLPLQFQLISISSKYLCSRLLTASPHPLCEVHVIRLEKITPNTKLSDALVFAFASAREATWADLMFFMKQASPGLNRGAADSSHTAVWRLDWVSPAESGIGVNAAFFWRITGALPLHSRVQDAETTFTTINTTAETKESTVMYIALATAKGGAVCTPPDRAVPKSEEPPPLPTKETHRETSPNSLPRRDLSAAFNEAQKEEEKKEEKDVDKEEYVDKESVRKTDKVIKMASAENASTPEKKENCTQQPTYAEVLMRRIRQNHCDVTESVEKAVREWRLRLIALRKEIHYGLCTDAAPRIAREQISQLQREEEQQKQCRSGCEMFIAVLLKAGLQEMLCDVLFDVSASLLMGGEKHRHASRLLQECINTARTAGEELEEIKGDLSAEMRISLSILQLRLLRHRCCAAVLLGQPVTAALLQESLRQQKRLMTTLQEEIAIDIRLDSVDGDSAEEQFVSGIYTAALSLMEMSLLVKKSAVLCDDVAMAAGSLLLWLRDTSGGSFAIPFALIARLEERAAVMPNGRLHEMRRRCERNPAVSEKKRNERRIAAAEFSCGIVRSVQCSADFDHKFARTKALVGRIEAATAMSIRKGTVN